MDKQHQKMEKQTNLVGIICKSLFISLPAIAMQMPVAYAIPQMGSELNNGVLNPNPSIFNEYPYNRAQTLVSTGMSMDNSMSSNNLNSTISQATPDNSSTTPGSMLNNGILNPNPSIFNEPPYNRGQSTSPTISQPPLPQQQQNPITRVRLMNGMVNIRLMNATSAVVSYQVIGGTKPRRLLSRSNVMLRAVKTPVTVTFNREDGGLLRVTPQATARGVLQVRLNEATNLSQDSKAMRIQRGGQVYLN